MKTICSFPPLSAPLAKVLVLGSMPGAASLAAGQYYAHKRNGFWPIMGALFGAGSELPYAARVAILGKNGVAVWDVLQSCVRIGSLDSAIEDEAVNDFERFLKTHPKITHVFFNGAKAEQSFLKHVARRDLVLTRLPSTSPAHAGMSFKTKLGAWSVIKDVL